MTLDSEVDERRCFGSKEIMIISAIVWAKKPNKSRYVNVYAARV